VTTIYAGLSVGAVYALVALGYNIVYLSAGTLNFAHAALMTSGIFLTYWGTETAHLPFGVAVAVAAGMVAVLAGIVERIAIRPVRSHDGHLVTTVGVSTILAGAAELIWGSDPIQPPFPGPKASLTVLGGSVLRVEIVLMVLAVVLTGLVWLWLRRSLAGLACLAAAEDREATSLRGVNARRLSLVAFVVSGLLAGLAAAVVGPKSLAYPTLGAALALKGFVALAIGGFGSVVGGLVGGFALGLVEAVAAQRLGGGYPNLIAFAVLLTVLLARPTGLMGERRERLV
jgi:branched-chain amino acid transport system permease protein